MNYSNIPALENKYIQDLKSANKLSPFIYGTAPNQVEGLFYTSPNSNFFFEEMIPKKRIVLHFTAGHLKGDLNQLTQQDYHVSVPFVIARNGTIFQLFSSKYWSHHLDMTSNNPDKIYDKEAVAIELSNYGYLNKVGQDLETIYSRLKNKDTGKVGPVDIYTSINEADAYNETNQPFRDKTFYASYTDAQMKSLIKLVRWLSDKYSIPKVILPEEQRFEATKAARDFLGITSHVNYRTDGKWDIGPAFDWDGLVNGINEERSGVRGGAAVSKPSVNEDNFTRNKSKGDRYNKIKKTIWRGYDPRKWE